MLSFFVAHHPLDPLATRLLRRASSSRAVVARRACTAPFARHKVLQPIPGDANYLAAEALEQHFPVLARQQYSSTLSLLRAASGTDVTALQAAARASEMLQAAAQPFISSGLLVPSSGAKPLHQQPACSRAELKLRDIGRRSASGMRACTLSPTTNAIYWRWLAGVGCWPGAWIAALLLRRRRCWRTARMACAEASY